MQIRSKKTAVGPKKAVKLGDDFESVAKRLNLCGLLRIATLLLATCLVDAHAEENAPYLPLKKVTVTAADGDVEALMAAIANFSAAEGLSIEHGDFPKRGRPVVNETIRLRGDTFFHVGNFRKPGEFEIVAYSHDPESAWKMKWDRLVSLLSARFQTAVSTKR